MLLDAVDLVAGVMALETHRESLGALEKYLLVAIAKLVEQRAHRGSLLPGAKYAIISDARKPLVEKICECLVVVDVARYLRHVVEEVCCTPDVLIEVARMSLACLVVQILLSRMSWTNLKRKTFHVFAFGVFYKQYRLSFLLAEPLLVFLGLLSASRAINSLFRPFLSRNDRGGTVLSHIYLLSACVYPRLFLSHVEYVSCLISVCFQDSAASIVGEWLGKTRKSAWGAAAGMAVGTMVYFALYGTLWMAPYFVYAGLVEYLVPINDNVSIPLFSVLYFLVLGRLSSSSSPSWGLASPPSGSLHASRRS